MIMEYSNPAILGGNPLIETLPLWLIVYMSEKRSLLNVLESGVWGVEDP